MSVRIMSMVWDSPVFRCNTKLIMLCLADFSNDEGYCWPSLERISNKCGISRSTLKAQLANLCNDGFIRKELRKKRTDSGELTNDTNVYWISIEKLQNPESDLGQNSPQPKSGLGRKLPEGGPKSDPKPSIDPPYSINTPIVPKKTEPKKRKAKSVTSYLTEDFSIQPEMADWYSQQADFVLEINTATAQWRDAMLSKQRKYADWVAAWRNGMRNANKWAVERESRQQGGVNSYAGQDYSAPKGFRS